MARAGDALPEAERPSTLHRPPNPQFLIPNPEFRASRPSKLRPFLDEKGVQVFQVGKTYEQQNIRVGSNITLLVGMGVPVGDVIWNRVPFALRRAPR
jgi:hypothetical protein